MEFIEIHTIFALPKFGIIRYKAHSSSGQDARFSSWKQEFDSPMGCQVKRNLAHSSSGQDARFSSWKQEFDSPMGCRY